MDRNKFINPPALCRPAPFWSWNDRLDKDELKRQIQEMSEKGWGSYFMHSRVGLVTGYLSDEWMELVCTCAEEAGRTGTYAWLYDEDKWPSGFAGGEVPEMDEGYRSRALVLLSASEITKDDTVLLEAAGRWEKRFICKRVSSLGNRWFNGASYVDLMNPNAVKAFIGCTHERYKKACGEYFGKEIPGIFTDEPCYLMEGYYQAPVLPWSDFLPPYFEKRKGYKLEENLEQLFYDAGDYRKVRFDFFDCATRLFMESFTKHYFDWCKANNLKMTGHFMAEDSLTYQMQWVGAAMPHYQFMHWPGIDKLCRHIEQLVTVKQVTSVADQLDKEHSFSEVFGCVGQQVSFYHRKWIADWQAALGISFVNHHLSLYSMRGERKRDYPANLFYQQPWWEGEKPFSDYIGRLNYAVSSGKRKVDILVLHPVASVWSEYSPLHKANGLMVEKNVYDQPFEKMSKDLIANKLDFHYGDEIIMESHAKVENGKLVIGSQSYSTVVVPPCCTLSANTTRLLEEFLKSAGKVRLLLVQTYPDRVDGEKQSEPVLDGATRAESIEQAVLLLDTLYQDRVQITDMATGKNADKVIIQERTSDSAKTIFLANTDEKREVRASIRIPGTGKPVILDLMSGECYEAPASRSEGAMIIELVFYPAGSLLLQIADAEESYPPVLPVIDSGVSFGEFGTGYQPDGKWEVEILDYNALPLNNVTLSLDGVKVLEHKPVAYAWHEHFYKAPDGTPFKAEYAFDVREVPTSELFAAIECAENLDRITLNGHELKPMKQRGELGAFDRAKSWLDVNFTKVPMGGFVFKGVNVLALEGKKVNNITGPCMHARVPNFKEHKPTEVEAVYIVGDFKVMDFNREAFAITRKDCEIDRRDLTSSGYPFYTGRVRFRTEFTTDGKNRPVLLRVDNVEAADVELSINGKYAGVKFWAPYVFDITDLVREGNNNVEITAVTTLFNLMGPNRFAGILDEAGVSPITFVDFGRYTSKYVLVPFGIDGITIL